MHLPPSIAAYFAADRCTDTAALTDVFTTDAVVRDEGASHVGRADILAWRLSSREKYGELETVPVEQAVDGDDVTVRCRVSGDFPGSPALLDFRFTLSGGQISGLEIH